MKKYFKNFVLSISVALIAGLGCKKNENTPPSPPLPTPIGLGSVKLNITVADFARVNYDVPENAVIRLYFNNAVDKSTVAPAVSVKENG